MKNKAIFLDRDGVITKLVYDTTLGIIHTPFTPNQITFVNGVIDFLKKAKENNYLLILISNQPNIGIKKMSKQQFLAVKRKITAELKKNNIVLDAQYYCLHHPFADIKSYRKSCECRKPKTLLYEKAIKKFSIDVKKSFAIGDSVFDIMAGQKINLKTILLANINEAAYFEELEKQLKQGRPDFVIKKIEDAKKIITNNS